MTAPTPDHEAAHRRFCELLTQAGLPQPDEAAYFNRAVVFLFHHSQAVILIDLDEPDDDAGTPDERDGFAFSGRACDAAGASGRGDSAARS
jgi:hypothetical protein